jgi:hypothetical protein
MSQNQGFQNRGGFNGPPKGQRGSQNNNNGRGRQNQSNSSNNNNNRNPNFQQKPRSQNHGQRGGGN